MVDKVGSRRAQELTPASQSATPQSKQRSATGTTNSPSCVEIRTRKAVVENLSETIEDHLLKRFSEACSKLFAAVVPF
ncbi:unnamed protein product [Toxocara canis]|uniref:Uncharacterized protein n=1 Tax=Toxocara canis TaxID=6265 RepID=A0A183VEM8_TOXCA|nr:unnamed protein product [Toxocara canis]